jgi:transcriptional regulator with XRE-family HTH domain
MSDQGSLDIGSKLRELRERRNLSLRALADLCDVSPNTVSLIERGLSSPSVDTLQRLATGLRIPIASFFETGGPPARLVLTPSTQRRTSRGPGMTIENVGSGLADYAFAAFLVTIEPGSQTKTRPIQHSGAEWAYCLQGLVAYEVEGMEYHLGPGDAVLLDASLPHLWQNPGRAQAQMILILDAGTHHDLSVEQHLAGVG